MDAIKNAFFTALRSAPPGGVTPATLAKATGAGETWTRSALSVLCARGAAVAMPGCLYAPVPGADLRASYEAALAGARAATRDLMAVALPGQGVPCS